MRTTSLAVLLTLAAVAPASGQSGAGRYAYGLNPYDPFDAEILRNYGSVLVAQTPLSELRKLDPYDPTHAALLRSLGGGIPGWPWLLSGATADSWSPFAWSARAAAPPPNVLVVVVGQPPATTAAAASAAPATPSAAPPPGAVGSLRRPESNDGVWIPYAGQRWVAAGAAVPLDPAAFVRIGEYGGFPVFRRTGEGEDVIYVPSRQDLVAPYRVKR